MAEFSPKTTTAKKPTFMQSIQPMQYFSRIFGFMSFKVVHDSNGSVHGARIRVIDVLWCIITIGLHSTSAVYYSTHFGCGGATTSVTLGMSTKIIAMFRRFSYILYVVIDFCNSSKLVKILRQLNAYDEKVRQYLFTFYCSIR